MDLKYRKPQIIALGILLLAGSAVLIILLQPPVVIVTDHAFLTLYGPKRAEQKRFWLSVRVRRPVRFAAIAEDAGQDAVSFAVNAVSNNPAMVFFPERYLEGAKQYMAGLTAEGKSPKGRIYVLNSSHVKLTLEGAQILEIDRETDLYRAGMCAALMARYHSGDSGDIEVFDMRDIPRNLQEAFIAGLTAMGYTKPPVFRRYTESVRPGATACAVMLAGYNSSVFATAAGQIPAILFTWLDPHYTPAAVQLVFDDSLLAVIAQAVRGTNLPHSESHLIPSRIPSKIELERLFEMLARTYNRHSETAK